MQGALRGLRSQLRYQIIGPFLLLTVLVAVVGSVVVFYQTSSSLQERFNNQLASVSRMTNDVLLSQEQANLQFLREVAFDQRNQNTGAPGVAEAFANDDVKGLKAALDPFFRVGISRSGFSLDRLIAFDRNGQTVSDFERAAGIFNRDFTVHPSFDISKAWFTQRVLNSQGDSRGDKYAGLFQFKATNSETDTLYFATISPVRQGTTVVGGLIAAIRVDGSDGLLRTLVLRSQSAGITLYDQSGRLLASTFSTASVKLPSMSAELMDAFKDGTSELTLFSTETVDGRKFQFAYIPLTIRGTSVGILAPALARDYAYEATTSTLWPMTLIVVALVGLLIGGGVITANRITAPLGDLAATAEAIIAGDLTRRVHIQSLNEIGVLARSFNSMTGHLTSLYGQVQNESIQRAAIVESVDVGIVVCDTEGRIILINRATRQFLNISAADPPPIWFDDIPLVRLTDGVPGFGSQRANDLFFLRERIVRATANPVIASTGQHFGSVCVIYDMITEVNANKRESNLILANEAIYNALAQGFGIDSITAMAEYIPPILPTEVATHIPEGFDHALVAFKEISAMIHEYQDATAPALQRNYLLRASAHIEQVAAIAHDLAVPYSTLLHHMVNRWRPILAVEGGRLARDEEQGPIPNPYVAGNPVYGDLFVGREDILRRLNELWSGSEQRPSVILYGHRRMGKSSILRNLTGQLEVGTIVINYNLQRIGLVENASDLLYTLAEEIHRSLPIEVLTVIEEPDEGRFFQRNPYTAFEQYLHRIDASRGNMRLILAIDEFEKIEEWIIAGRLEPQLLDSLRGMIQTYPWFVLALAGLHTLEEMTHNYWNPLFGSVSAIPVSFLSLEGARRLITQPTLDFSLNYTPDAIEQVITLTNGQPYLIQLIGHALVSYFNRQTISEGIERKRLFTIIDIAAVIEAPEFHRDGHAYFDGVWSQAHQSHQPSQTTILMILSAHPEGCIAAAIAQETALDLPIIMAALETLVIHDVITCTDGYYRYTVELMRRWVLKMHGEKKYTGDKIIGCVDLSSPVRMCGLSEDLNSVGDALYQATLSPYEPNDTLPHPQGRTGRDQ
ncbi:MAG: HAMP domain-containing protein [Chloroflexales bacterium]